MFSINLMSRSLRNTIKRTPIDILKSNGNVTKSQLRPYYMYSAEPFHPIPNKEPEWKSAEEAISVVTSG